MKNSPSSYDLAALYRKANNLMRNTDGLQPQEAFDELLKYLSFRQHETGLLISDRGAASALRKRIRASLANLGGIAQDWHSSGVRLSDAALLSLHELFADVDLATVDLDLRSAALREFLSPELRRGLGVFLTPDEVVRTMVSVVAPTQTDVVCDPACGSGTFLVESVLHMRRQPVKRRRRPRIVGNDISGRMMLLAELNLAGGDAEFEGQVLDTLTATEEPKPKPTVILTNPPFGVYVDRDLIEHQKFATVEHGSGRIQSETVFVEQCLRWLRPGGRLGIVVPRSVISNATLDRARAALDNLGRLEAVINLPPETFASTGTQTNTAVLFFRKRKKNDISADPSTVAVAEVTNVGYDTTGRVCEGSQLESVAHDLSEALTTGREVGLVRLAPAPDNARLQTLGGVRKRRRQNGHRYLGDLVLRDCARTGKTPPRRAYVEEGGVFTVKVGNLSGAGIDWTPRNRNFVRPESVSKSLWLEEGDVLLTSSAHNPKYIAKKVDLVHEIPSFLGGRATFVGEVLRLRVKPGALDPFELLALLRNAELRSEIQRMIRGQTAHLRPKDLLELQVPETPPPAKLVELLREEAKLASQLNRVRRAQAECFWAEELRAVSQG